jgi:hypothetical protein
MQAESITLSDARILLDAVINLPIRAELNLEKYLSLEAQIVQFLKF